jgi:hypothetical protein
VKAETCSDVACAIYTRKEVVAKEAIITVFTYEYYVDLDPMRSAVVNGTIFVLCDK